MPQFMFLNDALDHFLQAVQNTWQPIFQMQGIQILLAISAIAFAVYAIQFVITQDVPAFILGFGYTVISLAVLHTVFLYSQELANGVLNGFLQWGQQTSGMSPNVLTPSGVMETGLRLARLFFVAAGHASWFHLSLAFLQAEICAAIIIVAFALAAIVYLLALIQVYALIAAASVLLAFAALPWTWNMFPGWGLTVLSACIKVFFLLCVLAIGLNEAAGWTATMAAATGTIVEDASLAFEAMVESILFLGLVYYIPGLMASMVMGAAGLVFNAGESMIGSVMGTAAAAAPGAAAAGAEALVSGTASLVADGATAAHAVVSKLLLR
jgi:P-type conjugative transfer protein TrbL